MSNIQIIFFYVIPFFISLIIIYYDSDSVTVKDFLKTAWWALIPVWNIFVVLIVFLVFISIKTERLFAVSQKSNDKINIFLNTKLKK